MPTLKFVLQNKKLNNGKQPVYLKLSDRTNRLHIGTGFYARVTEFENGFYKEGRRIAFEVERLKNGHVEKYTNKTANAELRSILVKANEILDRYAEERADWSFDMFRNELAKKPSHSMFLDYVNEVVIPEHKAKGAFKRVAIISDTIRSMELLDSQLAKRQLVDINSVYIEKYIKGCKEKGNGGNTIGMRLTEIRCILNQAITEGVITGDTYPFSTKGRSDRRIKISNVIEEDPRTNNYLTIGQMKAWANKTFDDERLEIARRLFLFSFRCRGINWKDMALLTTNSIYEEKGLDMKTGKPVMKKILEYKRSKTAHSKDKGKFDITITPDIQELLDWFSSHSPLYADYLLPIIRKEVSPEKKDEYIKGSRRRLNEALKEIAKVLGFPKKDQDITIYTARHTFAMGMKARGESNERIGQSMGHKSLKTTNAYLERFSHDDMAEHTTFDLTIKEKPKRTMKDTATEKPKRARTKKPKV